MAEDAEVREPVLGKSRLCADIMCASLYTSGIGLQPGATMLLSDEPVVDSAALQAGRQLRRSSALCAWRDAAVVEALSGER